MRIRFLKPEEWTEKLTATQLPELLPYVSPQNITIIVAEDEEGKVVGSIMALKVTHLEGLWVDPQHRGGRVAWQLYQQALAVARIEREHFVFGAAANSDERMDDLITRCGGRRLPMRLYSMAVGGH